MPIVIGAKRESDFTGPIGMLGDCHRRIDRFLNVLVRVAAERPPFSNIDDDLFASSEQRLQVKFDWVITARQARSYVPPQEEQPIPTPTSQSQPAPEPS